MDVRADSDRASTQDADSDFGWCYRDHGSHLGEIWGDTPGDPPRIAALAAPQEGLTLPGLRSNASASRSALRKHLHWNL
jgi:hypothetical protein